MVERTVEEKDVRALLAGWALGNAVVCDGKMSNRDARNWFGDRMGIEREEVIAAQAVSMADAIIKRLKET